LRQHWPSGQEPASQSQVRMGLGTIISLMKTKSSKAENNSLIKLNSLSDVKDFLSKPTLAVAEALTGILAKSGVLPESYIFSAGRIVQSAVKGRLLTQFGKELNKYREEGKIKEDYFATHKNQATLLEFLKFIDGDIPDEEMFSAIKSIFFCGVSEDADSKKEEVAYQLLLLCKKLNSNDILILKACYRIYTGEDLEGVNTGINSFGDWVNVISNKIGYDLPELVSAEDDKLVALGLLSGRTYSDKSGIRVGKEFRLTSLSIKLCEFITKWK